jgi:menaquinone-specific isochorismate synthase
VKLNKTSILNEFESFLESVTHLSSANKLSNLVSFSFEIPAIEIVTLTTSNIARNGDIFYWNVGSENIEFLACCPLLSFNEFGDERLSNTSRVVNKLENNFKSNWTEHNLEEAPLIVGGIKFAPNQNSELWGDFSDSDWFVPKIIFYKKLDKTFLIYNFFNNPSLFESIKIFDEVLIALEGLSNSEPPETDNYNILPQNNTKSFFEWEKIVNKALENISEGMLSKVVLSREVKIQLNKKPFIPDLLKKLSERYPQCNTFSYQRGDSIFLGASPEKLAKVSNGWIEVDALAGSAPRGNNEFEDVEMEYFLLNSEKNLFEQRAVVNFIHNLLSKISDEIIFDDKPKIRKLPNIQHLWTIMKAKLNKNIKMFDLLMKLHPTPAICGDPWKIAKDFILEMEPHDRGLYSGNIGWFNFNGRGEFAVAIRTALIKNNKLYAYSGCGIVEGSEASSEFEESEIKLKPILSLFVDEKVYQP